MGRKKKKANRKKKVLQGLLLLITLIFLLAVVFNLDFSRSLLHYFPLLNALSTATFAVSINVDNVAPSVFLIEPRNITYNFSSIDINFTVEDVGTVDKIWYNLDNGENITIAQNLTIAVNNSGSHIISLFANDTGSALNFSEVTFTRVNFTIIANEFSGNTTKTNNLSDKQLQNLTNFTLEVPSKGKIIFTDNVNISNFTNFDAFVEISDNFIFLDSSELSNFNKTAELYLLGLTFTNPRILKDGEVCSSSICEELSYTGGILVFSVAHFTNYSSEETPTDGGGTSGGGGGGGGGGSSRRVFTNPFTVEPDSLKSKVQEGQTKREILTITNNLNRNQRISLDAGEIRRFILFSEENFVLEPGEAKDIGIDIIAPQFVKPDLYLGEINVKSDEGEKIIRTAIEITSSKPLFDISIDVPESYRTLKSGEELIASVSIIGLERIGLVDVNIEYIVRDEEGNDIFKEKEIIGVDVQTSFIKNIKLPENIKPGTYILYVRGGYDGTIGSSSSFFRIEREPSRINIMKYLYYGLGILIGLAILYYGLIKLKRFRGRIKKKIIKKKPEGELHQLGKQIRERIRKK